jgi:hypothetical protein
MGSKHSRARDARQRKYRIERRRVMREVAKTLKAEAPAQAKAKAKAE